MVLQCLSIEGAKHNKSQSISIVTSKRSRWYRAAPRFQAPFGARGIEAYCKKGSLSSPWDRKDKSLENSQTRPPVNIRPYARTSRDILLDFYNRTFINVLGTLIFFVGNIFFVEFTIKCFFLRKTRFFKTFEIVHVLVRIHFLF